VGTEHRLARFCELVAAAIANAESRAALNASRARIVAASDDARRRTVRDVHDGAQQRLVHTLITLKRARAALGDHNTETGRLLDESLAQAHTANEQLRELAHGILPAALARGGLRAGVDSLVSHLALPVDTELLAGRLPEPVETAAYFVIAEALTNTVKHAGAGRARVRAIAIGDRLELEVADDGRGGADPAWGPGLTGLADRVETVGGSMTGDSPPGAGTTLSAVLPLPPTAPSGQR
jgi:signal transduction histidine kinase